MFNITLTPDAIMPVRKINSAGYDIASPHDITIYHREHVILDTGIAIHIDKYDVCGIILPRSSMAGHGLFIENTVPLIDYQYTGNIILKLSNRHDKPIIINKGERFCQIVFPYIYHPDGFNLVDQHHITERGVGGFGSTN